MSATEALTGCHQHHRKANSCGAQRVGIEICLHLQAWDVATGTCQHTLSPHNDKVQALAWNPAESSCLLSGGFDQRACLSDVRTPDVAAAAWQCSADVESLAWSPHAPTQFVVSAESGEVSCFDTRNGAASAPVFTLAAHNKPTTSVAFNPTVPHLLVTGSIDKMVRLCTL